MSYTPVEKCRDFWHDLDFTTFQKELDSFTVDIAKQQDEADAAKKKLIEMSKEFKKTASEDTRKAASQLLKAFQMEVDGLTKRSKHAEGYFLNIYRKLADAPDPYPILLQASSNRLKLSNLTDLEIENKQLRETLEQYNNLFTQYKAQETEYEDLKKKYEEQTYNIEREIDQRVNDMNESVSKDFNLKSQLLMEKNEDLEKTLAEQNQLVCKLQENLEKNESEFFEIKSRLEEELQNKNSEIEQYLFEIEVANQKLADISTTSEVLQNAGIDISHREETDMKIKILESEMSSKDSEIMRLIEETHSLQNELHNREAIHKESIARLQHQFKDLSATLDQSQTQISQQSDYEDIKKELSILKTVEFGGQYDEGGENKSLELLLLDKNRALQNDNSNLRLEVHNYSKKVSNMEAELKQAKTMVEKRATEIAQLENELTCLQAHRVREEADGEASLPTIPDTDSVKNSTTNNMLAIVTSQKDRLKTRNELLETDFQQLKNSYAILQQDNATLRDDNMKLYERIKFLQTVSTAPGPASSQGSEDTLTLKYSSQYEAHIDPFSAFNRNERKRKYTNLNSAERVVLNLSKMILGDKRARVGVFFYTLFLHLLTFVVLYKFAVSEDCVHLSDCNEKFEAHMQHFHPGGGP